ncbi:MAG TPA: transglycosylase SLT domain-containing protein [Anaeromyxobacteraceae bacterium]|nr:transglycosylase SLT domain-containing protein [Anaeromyxobacteraceae bacterium]
MTAALAARAALPRGALRARADLSLGLALAARGQPGEAAPILGDAAADLSGSPLQAAARAAQGRSLLAAGQPGAVAALEAAATGDGPLAVEARWDEADALLDAGEARRAAALYEQLLRDRPLHPRASMARVRLAAAHRALGEPARAIAEYRNAWRDEPGSPAARAAARALRAWREAGGAVPPPAPEERLARAQRFLQLARARQALRALDHVPAGALPLSLAPRAALVRALALSQRGRREEAEASARALLAAPATPPEVRRGAEVLLARAAARGGRIEEALERYAGLAVAPPLEIPGLSHAFSHDLPDEAAWLGVWLRFEAGQWRAAAEGFRRYLARHPSGRHADDSRWFLGFALWRSGAPAAAQAAFHQLSGGPLAAGALYWQARLSPAGSAQARRLYRSACAEAPSGWYGLLAASRLAALGEEPPRAPAAPAALPFPDHAPDRSSGASLERATALFSAGLREDALSELRELAASRRGRAAAPLAAELAAFAADAEIPHRLSRDALLPTRRALRWSHPEAFPAFLPRVAAGAGVEPHLLLAVMRRESAFRPDARSAAGAEGLLQLIPPTADRIAAVDGLPRDAARRLSDAEISVGLGASYLGLLQSRFAEPAVVLAAYNAGPGAAAGWARERAGMALDEWVEAIPYRETRHYVKTVLADAVLYRQLWGGPPVPLDPARPVPTPGEGVGF